MKTMRQYINLINEAFTAYTPKNRHAIVNITANTDENRKHVELIKQYEKEIEDDINSKSAVPIDIKRIPNENSKEWHEHDMWLNYELDKARKKEARKKEVRRIKAQQEHDVKIQGIRLAAKDAMDDAIEQDRELVSKLAKQAITNADKKKQHVTKMAHRQLKK